ncbi:MAG: response regulator [Candidatus Eisenbacteria bacterium]|nr:response regulator [Candidatus Latescibacterota bacterium]MBD3301338.1 response regulator [Candidatus Eisenbacteria bacterium]
MTGKVLIIDDEPAIARSLTRVLEDGGYKVETALTGEEGLRKLEAWRPGIVLLDLRLPDADGLELIPRIRRIEAATQVIVLTAYADTKAAVSAIKRGAADFLRKPYDLDEVVLAVATARKASARDSYLAVYRRRETGRYAREQIIGESRRMRETLDLVHRVARSDAASVLILGESGTGKELVARAIHFESGRRRAPFMELNCSTLQETLLENELFGHERGAFTGATHLKRGLVELSDGGTLFLDEIGDLPASTQAKLLRFIEYRTFKRVGGSVDIDVDIRIVTATNVDLEAAVEAGEFREDLFWRLQVVRVEMPPLREREEDVNLLAVYFLRRFSFEMKKGFRDLSPEVRELFLRYRWPGNVRELRNLIERIVLLEDGETLLSQHLPSEFLERAESGEDRAEATRAEESAWNRTLHDVEEEHIARVLVACEGNKSQAARVLGLSRQGLLDRLKRSAHLEKVSSSLTCQNS